MDDLSTLHEQSYKALVEIDQILKKNNITYFLIDGTALGAVRHHGFIPWDDDIDIAIFYKDREKVSFLLEKELREPFQWKDFRTTKDFPRLYGKVLYKNTGCIDVFLFVKTSNHLVGRYFQWINRKILFKLYKAKISYLSKNEISGFQNKLKSHAANLISRGISKNTLMELIKRNETLFEKKGNPKFYLDLYGAYSLKKETISAEWIYPFSYVKFEGGTFPSLGELNPYLTNLYGDYMKPPKQDDRKRRHGEKFY